VKRWARLAVGTILAAAGVLLALFFGLLYFVADCGAGCAARGEHAPVFALVGAGAGLVAAGVTLGRGWRVALAWGLVVGGAIALATSAWGALTQGDGGWTWASAAGGLIASVVGFWTRSARRAADPK